MVSLHIRYANSADYGELLSTTEEIARVHVMQTYRHLDDQNVVAGSW